jgi:polysaccharide export outer membrane protein
MSLALLRRASLLAIGLVLSGIAFAQGMTVRSGDGAQPIDPRVGIYAPAPGPLDPARGGVASPSTPANVAGLIKDYRIGPNDLIEVEILDLENFKRTVRVNAAGAITLPLVGSTLVSGLTAQEVEARLAQRYGEKYLQNPQISVFVKEFTTERITMDGAVAKPGIYPITGQITLLRALALAGGLGPLANPEDVTLFRVNDKGAREVATFNIDEIRTGKNPDPDLRGDDLVVVQRKASRVMFKDSLFRDILDTVNPFTVFK